MYNAVELAKYIVTKCVEDKHPISNLQLQKILYYIQKDFLQRDSIAFNDAIEAWQFGPVVPNAYYTFFGSGSMKISDKYDCTKIKAEFTDEDKTAIDRIVNKKRLLNPWDMVNETHRDGGAWAQIYRDGIGNHELIPRAMIKAVG